MGDPHARCGRVGAFARLGKLGIERWVGAESRGPAEEVHAPVPNGAGAADGVRDGETGLDGFARLAPCADGGEREAEVDRQHGLALFEPGVARGSGGAPARVERAHQLAARLAHDREGLPGVDRGGGDAARLGDLEQVIRFSFGVLQISLRTRSAWPSVAVQRASSSTRPRRLALSRVTSTGARRCRSRRRERGRSARATPRCGPGSPRRTSRLASRGARFRDRPRAGRGVSMLRRARAPARTSSVCPPHDRARLGHADRFAERIGRQGAPRRAFPMNRGFPLLLPDFEMLGDRRRVLAHLGEPKAGRAHEAPACAPRRAKRTPRRAPGRA